MADPEGNEFCVVADAVTRHRARREPASAASGGSGSVWSGGSP